MIEIMDGCRETELLTESALERRKAEIFTQQKPESEMYLDACVCLSDMECIEYIIIIEQNATPIAQPTN